MQQEGEFFDLDKADYGLAAVQVDVWEGFIFVNLDYTNTVPLRECLGELGKGLEGYPFGAMTQVYKYRAEVNSNWKVYIDAFAEFSTVTSVISISAIPVLSSPPGSVSFLRKASMIETTKTQAIARSAPKNARCSELSQAPRRADGA